MTPDTYIALLALLISVVSLITSIHVTRGQRAIRVAEKQNQIRSLIAEIELLWQGLRQDAQALLRSKAEFGQRTLSPELTEILDEIMKVSTDLSKLHPPVEENRSQSEASVERRLAATIEIVARIRQKESNARDIMRQEGT